MNAVSQTLQAWRHSWFINHRVCWMAVSLKSLTNQILMLSGNCQWADIEDRIWNALTIITEKVSVLMQHFRNISMMSDLFSNLYDSKCVNEWHWSSCVLIFKTDETVIWIMLSIYSIIVWSCMVDICIWGFSISEVSIWNKTVRYCWIESNINDLCMKMQITVSLFSECEKSCWTEGVCRTEKIWKIKNERKIRGSDKKILKWLIDWRRVFQQAEKWKTKCGRHNIKWTDSSCYAQ